MISETVKRIDVIKKSLSGEWLSVLKKFSRQENITLKSAIWLFSSAQRSDAMSDVPLFVIEDGLTQEARFGSGSFFQYNRYIYSKKAEDIKNKVGNLHFPHP